ncbi:glycosyltransferase [Microbacterium sp. NPDC055903]
MGAQLRVILDQVDRVVHDDIASASLDLTAGLIATAPSGCEVEAIVPAGGTPQVRGLSEVRTLSLARRELAASWQLGIAPGVGGGLVHAPSLMAPLVRHDRVNDSNQVVVTLWDLDAWEAPSSLPKAAVAWQRGMLRRAAKHADAVVVPTHAFAERLGGIARFGDRVRVIAGAQPTSFTAPTDAVGRRRTLDMPDRYVVLTGPTDALQEGFAAASAADVDAVVLDAPEGVEPDIVEIASAAGLPERRVHVRGRLDAQDRAAVLADALVLIDVSARSAWPWRAVEAMALSIPVVAVDGDVHRDVLADGARLVDASELVDAVTDAVGEGAARLRVLAGDRSRAFSWASAAERVWALHADL